MFSTGVCRWLFLVISLSTWKIVLSSKEMRVVCYYTNWSVYRPGAAKFSPQNINPYMCTHLIYAFGGFTKENTLKPFDKYQDIEKGGYAKFTGLKTYNKDLKTMLAIGGWNEGSSRFSSMVANPDRRKEFVKNAIKFLRLNHFDGLDLDWEYPSFRDGGKPRDRDNYAQLVQELREEFDRESSKTGRSRLLLTMAVPAGIEYINKGYDVPKLTKYLDWMNILSYDYHSAFEPAVNHHAPLYSLEEDSEYNYEGDLNIDHTIKHYLELGAEPNKLVLGIPTYGRSYTLFNPDAFEIGSPADGPGEMGEATRENGYLAYYEICDYVKNQDWEVEQPNSKAMGPYAFKENQWVGYDDEDIVRRKAEYVAENSLGGIMFWAIDNDDFRGDCHGKAYPLIEAGREALLKAYGLTEDNQIVPSSKPQKSRRKRPNKSTNKINKPLEETHVKIEKSSTNRRRNRIKPVEKEQPINETKSRRKLRRKDSSNNDDEPTSYSSLKVVTPSYTTPSPPSTPDMGGAFKCEDEGFFQHPKDCKKYFWCLSGAGDSGIVAHAFTCPAGLYFNKAADSCDYSQNVLCNKKMQKTSATTKKEEPSTTSTTAATIISSTRIPPKITAATSRTTFKQTTTTTEAFEDEYEYEDEEEDNNNTKTETEEEDPRVIKELIDLIKKAGGIEELEKQLRFSNGGAESSESSKFTTQSSISKSLYEKVISKAIKNNADTKKLYSSIQNSRGSQTDGLATRREKSPSQSGTTRGKLSYTSISRSRPANTKSAEDKEDTETENISEKTQSRSSAGKTNSVEYVNIRRPRVSTTTSEPENNSVFSRNKYLGETDDDEDDSEYDDGEDEEDVSINTPKKQTYTPQYVNIRRQRPSTTEEPTSSKYSDIRRGSSAPPEQSEQERDGPSTTSKYKFLRRGTTSTTSPPSSVTADSQLSRLQTTPASSSQPADKEISSKRYIQLTRGTTTERSSLENDKTIIGSEQALTSTDVFSANDSQLNNSNNASDTSEPLSSKDNNILIETETNKIVDTTTTSTTINGGDSLTTKKIPQVFDAKSTSTPVTESAILTAKVSQPNFRYRSRSKIDNQYSENIQSRQNIVRNASRFRPETSEKETREIIDRASVPQKRRIISTTEKNIEENRTYRPTELADLSSLTAVDFSKIKEFNIGQSSNRRRRPVITSSTTTSTEYPESSSSVKTSIRKLTEQSTFDKSRRLVRGRENQTQLVSESTKKFRRVTFGTTEEPSASKSIPENSESSTTPRNRKIIRRFRPGSRNPINFNEDRTKNVNENILFSREKFVNEPNSSSSSPTNIQQQTLNENNIESENEEDSFEDTNIDDEEENIKLSESNIRENSALNSFGSDPKFERKTFKSENLYRKSTIPEQHITTERYGTDIEVNKTKEPSVRIRTRKIIRKITPTPAPPNQIDPDLASRKRKIIRKLRPVTVANIIPEMHEDAENDNDDDSSISTDSPAPEINLNTTFNQSNETESEPESSDGNGNIDLDGLPEHESSIGLGLTSENYETTTTEIVVPKYVNKLFKLRPNDSRKRFKNAQENIPSSTEKTTSSSPKYKSYSRRPNYSNRRFTSTEKIAIDEKDGDNIDGEEPDSKDGASRGFVRYNSIEPLSTTLSNDFVTKRYNSLRRPSNKNTTSQIPQHSTEVVTDEISEFITTEFVNENITVTTDSPTTEIEALYETQMSTTESATVQPATTYDAEIITNSIETTKYDGVIQDVDLSTTSELPSETYVTTDNDSIYTIVTDESTDSTSNNITTEISTENYSSTTEKSTTNEIANTVPTILTSHRTSTLRSINLRPKYVPTKLKELSLNQPTEPSNIFKPTRFYGRTRTQFKSTTESSKASEDNLASEINSTTERGRNKFGKFKNGFRSGFSTKQNQLQSTSTTTVRPKNTYLYRYSTTKKSVDDVEEEDKVEYDEDTNDEDDDDEGENVERDEPSIKGNNLNQLVSTRKTPNRFTNKPTFSRTTEKEPNAEETLKNINTEAVRNRNKNLFSNKKRIMNIPVSVSTKPETQPTDEDNSYNSITTVPSATTSSSTESSTDSPTTEFVKSSDQQETTEYLTTLHHIFAQIAGDTETTTKQTTPRENSADKIERLIEVSRIVNVKTKEEKVKHNHVEQTTDEVSSILDKIGAINRVTSIKVVDVDGMTKHESENVNALSPIFVHSNASESTTSESPIKSSVDMIIQIAKVQEVPPPNSLQKVNLTNINVQIDASGIPDQLFSHREDRKIDIYGGSKISNSKTNDIDLQKAEIIDGRSHINIVTPRPIYNTEASTISLEGLFRADESLLFNRNSALNDELLETENSKFVNVRVLHPDESVRINKELRKDDKVIPIKILKQDEDDVATKARVVEILPKSRLDTIKIVPIRVEMSRSIAHNLPLIDLNRT
ncbi:unnamed protein product [Phaedon cochleariae]|uniref:Chitinase n=1 Tax=Phaedon cochleariae TaxID=80249 RepID=A0A9P0GXI3_PHACE|nr:unnamed protein product [Phaedon cochleariae]